jgi:hypothetical protein
MLLSPVVASLVCVASWKKKHNMFGTTSQLVQLCKQTNL